MAPNVELHFWPANDLNGDSILTITDEDEYLKEVKLRITLDELGFGEFTLARKVGFALFDSGAVQPEVFVRVLVHAYSSTEYLWGFFLDKRHQVVIHKDEDGEEEFRFGGPGPKFYLDRAALQPEQFTGSGWLIDLANGVFRWNEDATAGKVLNKLILEDAASDAPALPDLTKSFTNGADSDSTSWTADIAGPGDFEVPIGQSFLKTLWELEDLSDLRTTIYLGTVASPVFRLDAWNAFGEDVSGSAFGAGVCRLVEGVNIVNDSLVVEGTSLRHASHVIVEGKDGVWVTVPRSTWDPGEYVKYAKIEYPRSSNTTILTRAGLRWLRKQDNGSEQITVDILPGADDATGLYFPKPTGPLWIGNTVALHTGGDVSWTPLDYRNADQLVTGLELELLDASLADSTLHKVRSWKVRVQLNYERGGARSPGQGTSEGGQACNCSKGCVGTEVNVLLGLTGASLKASSEWSGRPVEDAVDGDDATAQHWSADITEGVIGEWMAADLGEAKVVHVYRVKQGYSEAAPAEPEGADEMKWYASNDPADWAALVDGTQASFVAGDWTLVETFTGEQTGSDTGRTVFPAEQEYRYWVLLASDGPGPGDGDAWNVQEAELWQTIAGDGNPLCHGVIPEGDYHPEYVREASAEWVHLTDGGATTLHSHSGGGSGGHDITEDGGAALTTRGNLDFRHGLDVTDDSGSDSTRVAVDEGELETSSLGTSETDTDLRLRPDGSGGVVWGTAPAAGAGSGNVLASPQSGSIFIPGLAMGDRKPASPGTYDEEFDGTADTLPTDWAWTAAPSGSDAWYLNSRLPSMLVVEGTGNTAYTLKRTNFNAAATFGIWARMSHGPWTAADKTGIRMYVMNSAENEGRCVEFRVSGSNSAGARALRTVGGAEATYGSALALASSHYYVGLTRASDVWFLWYSTDGVTWMHVGDVGGTSHTFTVDRLRFLMQTSSAKSRLTVDWVRYRTDTDFPRP